MEIDFLVRLSLPCICFVLVVHPQTVASTKEKEDEWLKKYGTNKNTSGTWPTILDAQEDTPALQALCEQCHAKAFPKMKKLRVTEAYVSEWLLSFPHNTNIEPIRATMVMYAIEERIDPDQRITYYYFTKGTKHDCVIYVRETEMEFRFSKEICGIVMPKKPPPNPSEVSIEYNDEDEFYPVF